MSGDDTRRSASGSLIRAFSGGARKALSSLSPNQVNQRTNNDRLDGLESVSSLDPNDDNVMMSTRHNFDDDSHLLPKMRSTAQRYGRYNPPEPQPRITTSAVRGHFQDFDQDAQSDDEDSIEIGRGHRGSGRNTPNKIDSDFALNIGNSSLWEVTGTPPIERRPRPTAKKTDGIERGSLRRDAQKRAASTNHNLASLGRPGARISPAKKAIQEQRRSGVTDKYEQFTENIDDSYYYGGHPNATADEPPSTVKPARFTSQNAAVAAGTPIRRNTVGTPRSAPNATVDSFALPEIPGMTELISGIRQDDTPIFSRSGKPRSKFNSRRVSAPLPNFIPVQGVPMPEEEKLIIAQLQLLKDRLAELESENETLRNDNQLLRAQVQELQNQNQRHIREREQLIAELDVSQNRHDTETQQREAELKLKVSRAEKALEAENRTLRERLDELQAQYDEETRQLTQRESKAVRDAQNAQAERQKLEEEKQRLVAELAQAKAEREAEMKRWNHEQKKFEARVQNREDTIHELPDAAPRSRANETIHEEITTLKKKIAALTTDRDYETANGTVRERELERQLQQTQAQHEQDSIEWIQKEDLLRAELEQEREKSRHIRKATSKTAVHVEKARGRSRSKSVKHGRKPSISIRRTSLPVRAPTVEVEDAVSGTDSTTDLSPFLAKQHKSFSKSKSPSVSVPADEEITYLSPIQTQDVRNIRRKIEEERLKRRVVSISEHLQHEPTEPIMSGALPKKSSMKDLTGRSITSIGKASHSATASEFDSTASESEDEPVDATRSRSKSTRRRSSAAFTEMTSAFILPDITLSRRQSQSQTHEGARPALSAWAKEILSSLAPSHDAKNCTICARLTSNSANKSSSNTAEINLPPLIPISTRPDHICNPDATLRPTEPPTTALARVLKALYDEHAHLLLRLHAEETKLATVDPGTSKRERDAVHESIAGVNKALKMKAEQIYGLYDVVEAHKGELGAREVEEIDRTLEEVRRSVGGRKRVVVESFHDSDDRVYGHGDD